jgi:16S rRNA (adenine1518-N6/adenine1519-N6)-dimethyltransferase
MISLAAIRPDERVLEIGTGRGALTKQLVGHAARLEGYEVERESYELLHRELQGTSLVLHHEDAFKSSPEFDVLLSSLPYSESSEFVEWLSRRRYDRAVVLLQRDFAMKITAAPGSPAYRAVSVISQASAHVEIVSNVGRLAFDPPPRVNSCLVTMRWKRTLNEEQLAMIKRIFSQKRRTVRAALKSLGLEAPASAPAPTENVPLQCRVNALRPDSVLAMVGVLRHAERARKGDA